MRMDELMIGPVVAPTEGARQAVVNLD